MDLQADIPFSFSIELVGGMALSPQPVQLIEGLAATPSWHGADVKATSTLCYDAYSGIYLTFDALREDTSIWHNHLSLHPLALARNSHFQSLTA